MSIIKGNIKKALGIGTIKVNGLEIDLGRTTAEDIVDFQELPAKAMGQKKRQDLNAEDGIRLQRTYRNYFVKYFMDKDPSLDKEQIELFVVRNFEELQKEFTIGYGIKSREEYDKDMADARQKAEEESKN